MPRPRPQRPDRLRAAQRTALLRAYVAPEVVAHIMSDGAVPLPSGVRLPVTVLFADIRGFTRLADTLPPERVVAILDQYFDAVTAPATAHGAMVDKLIGDAIMLAFGAPVARGDECRRALATAAAMQAAFAHLLPTWIDLPRTLRLGLAVGIAAGDAVLANVGAAARMDYTLIGSAVNRAARLTAAAAAGETLVDTAVRSAAARDRIEGFGRARLLRLKGFRLPVPAYPHRLSTPATRLPARTVVTDPVCGMKLDRRTALSAMRSGRRHFFCSARCRAAFLRRAAPPGR